MDTYIIHTSEIQLITMLLRNDTCMHMQHHKSHPPGNQSLLGMIMHGLTIMQTPMQTPLDQACYTSLQ